MGQIEVAGPDAEAFLQRMLTNDVSALPVPDGDAGGGAQYSLLCADDGGVLDDLFVYRLEAARYLVVTNASNHERDLRWLLAHAGAFDVELLDRIDDYAMLAAQGPRARDVVGWLADGRLPPRLRTARLTVAGVPDVLVCGTGYTGEDGVELLVAPDGAGELWAAIVAAGAQPAGLGARDTLRLEVGYHLYGNDLMETRGPIEAGLGWCCKEDTGFIGSDAVREVRRAGPSERLVGFRMSGRGIARRGNGIEGGGEVTSGALSPCLGVGVGMAYVPAAMGRPGTPLRIGVRGKTREAVVAERPLYRKERDG
jgi:aminomethyltransferase